MSQETEYPILRREVSVGLVEEGDGRTLVSRLVPYGEIATVSDDGGITSYREAFAPTAFDAQMNSPHRAKVFLNYRHGQSLQDQIGHALSLNSIEDDGLHGHLRVMEHPDGDKALAFVREKVLDKLSIEFRPERSEPRDGVIWRTKATLLGVALCPEGAYAGAEVLAVREPTVSVTVNVDGKEIAQNAVSEMHVTKRHARIPDLDPELVARLEAAGLVVPEFIRATS